MPPQRSHPAFTLIEVLVSIAVMSILMGALAPALGSARATARTVACQTTLRSLAQAQLQYSLSHRGHIASSVTSNRSGWIKHSHPDFVDYQGDTDEQTPTQVFDWITPLFGADQSFPANRAKKMQTIFDRFACAANGVMNDSIYIDGIPPTDRGDFVSVLAGPDGFRSTSYLAPHALYSLSEKAGILNSRGLRRLEFMKKYPAGLAKSFPSPLAVPARYTPRLDLMGVQLSAKAVVFDGSRYATKLYGIDFDITQRPKFFGAFTDSGPATDVTAGFGRRPTYRQHVDTTRNLDLSFRHGGSIGVAYFDGHVGSLTEPESRADPVPFFPGGSRWTAGYAATPEAMARLDPGDTLP